MNEEDAKREIAKRIKAGSFNFKERGNDVDIIFFERINILNLDSIDKSNLEYQFFGEAKVRIADENTDGGAYLSPSRNIIKGTVKICDNINIEISNPIIIENL